MEIKNKTEKSDQRLHFQMLVRLYFLHKHEERGYTLVIVLALMFILFALLSAYGLITKIERTTTLASSDRNTGFYAAEAGLNLRAQDIQQSFSGFNQPIGTSPGSIEACLDGDNTNNGSGNFACTSYTFGGQNGNSVHTANTYVAERPGNPKLGVIPRGEPFQDLNMQEYVYNLISVATKAGDSRPEAMLEMDIKSRVVPLFQFAVFYKNDLEILPGPDMVLSGPVHTNSNLYLGGNNTLRIKSQVTAVGDIFNSRKDNGTTYPSGRVQVDDATSTPINLLDANSGYQTSSALSRSELTRIWGNQIRPGFEPVEIPPMSFLSRSGDYFNKADLRFEYRPTSTVPVAVTVIKRNTSSTPVTLSEGEIRSLRQPVMTNFNCPTSAVTVPSTTLSVIQLNNLADALKVAIASAGNFFTISTLRSSTLNALNTAAIPSATKLQDIVAANSNLSSVAWGTIQDWTADQVAALANRCFKAAPLLVSTNFYNNREGRWMQLLQINLEGLTVWNRDGVYVEFSGGTVTNNNGNNGFSADHKLFDKAAANSNALPDSFQAEGLAAVDTTEGGLVFHATIDDNPAIADDDGTQSPYGFALTNAAQLPGLAVNATQFDPTGLTVVSDQAIYVQGDYNNNNKQPAAAIADSINVLSNACIDADNALSCGISSTAPNASNTTVNAAFLAGTDMTNSGATPGYNGGLENYPRFHENWNGINLTYRGSFISLGTPLHVSGRWSNQVYSPPERTWDYDPDFNDFAKLPPMTPNMVYLRQEVFVRNFDR